MLNDCLRKYIKINKNTRKKLCLRGKSLKKGIANKVGGYFKGI
jgi:hypothetical protein